MPRVNVVAREYAYGLRQSRTVADAVLTEAGCTVRHIRPIPYELRALRRFDFRWRRHAADVNLFLEFTYPTFFPLAAHQVFLPNPEWFVDQLRPHLPQLSLVLCKSRQAERVFTALGCRTVYTSFTSFDRRRPGSPVRDAFLLLGAKLGVLGARLAALWQQHPDWPPLTVVSPDALPAAGAPNVHHLRGFLSDDAIAQLQNEHRFHLCLSPAEGFGHKLNEGLACGAIVIALDGPPMNELVTPERGFLVPTTSVTPQRLGTAFDFDDAALAATVEHCRQLAPEERQRLSAAARAWFEENDRFFRTAFPRALEPLG